MTDLEQIAEAFRSKLIPAVAKKQQPGGPDILQMTRPEMLRYMADELDAKDAAILRFREAPSEFDEDKA